MQITIELELYYSKEGRFIKVATGIRTVKVKKLEEAKEEARECVRRHRLSNTSNLDLRWKVIVLRGRKPVWQHDETAGDPLLEPTGKTEPYCPL